jgi:protease-4
MQTRNPSAPRPCRHWPFWFVIFLLLFILAVDFWSGLGSFVAGGEKGIDEFPSFSETLSYGSGNTKVARISFSGIMTSEIPGGFFAAANPLHTAIRQVRAARQDDDVAAILFEMDSPGGEVTAADELYHELLLFRQSRSDRRVVVLVRGVAASGGYYASLPADRIIVQPTAIVGSIGVILQSYNLKELADKVGVKDVTVKSGKNKDMLNPLRDPTPEEIALLQAGIDAVYARFLSLVSESRRIPPATLRPLADGRIFTPEQALDAKLVDGIGYFEDAVDALRALLGKDDLALYAYSSSASLADLLFAPVESRARLALRALSAAPAVPRLSALWIP